MKKIILSYCLICLVSSLSYGQNLWFWQNPKPTGNSIRSVAFVTNDIVIAGGDAGMLLKSENSGTNWFPIYTGLSHSSSINDIRFLSEYKGILLGNAFIMITTDGGSTWINRVNSSQSFKKLCQYDSASFFAVSDGQILKTTNEGLSWFQILSNSYLNSVAFINSTTGIAVGYNLVYTGGYPFPTYYTRSLILKTTNSGSNWNADSLGNGFQIYDIAFLKNSKCFMLGGGGRLFSSTNVGTNWTTELLSSSEVKSMYTIDTNRIFLYGNSGSLVKTTNGGINWLYQSISTGFILNDLSFNNSGSGFIVGDNGVLHKTTNSGFSWQNLQKSSFNTGNFRCVHFCNENYGAIGFDNTFAPKFYKTTNGGINWFAQTNMVYSTFNDLFLINKDTIIGVGGSGITNRTTNGGVNWQYTQNGYGDLHGVYFINSMTGFIVGGGRIYKTTNTGISWDVFISNDQSTLLDVHFFDENTGAVIGSMSGQGGVILWTTDCGATWQTRNSGLNIYTPLNGIKVLSETNAIIAVRDGKILRTTNSGVNWTVVFSAPSSSYTFNEVSFRNPQNGIVVGNNGVILATSNGGLNWTEQQSNSTNNLNGCSVKGGNDFVVVGDNATVLSTSDINTIGIQTISSQVPNSFVLHQNYPNPFNPQTKIKFDVPPNVKGQTSNVKLVIYDLLGREVATLVNEELKPGTYEADWDGSNFSSGVYFYKIIAGDFTETKKMVLMK